MFKKVVKKFEKKFVATKKDFMLLPFHMKINKYYPVETWLNEVCYP